MSQFTYLAGHGTPKDLEAALNEDSNLINFIDGTTSALNQAVCNAKINNVEFLLSHDADLYLRLGSNKRNILATAIGIVNDSLHPEGKIWAKKENLEMAIAIFELLIKHEKEKYPEEILMLDRKSSFGVTPMDDLCYIKKAETDPFNLDSLNKLEKIIEKYHPGYVSAYYAAKMPKPKKTFSSHKRASKENKAKANLRKSSKLTATKERESTSSSWFDYIGSFFGASIPRSQGYEVIHSDPSLKKISPSSSAKTKID